ncbi:biogenesis of lysosome-related organelles complex 1 subunit 6 [Trichonephila clavata]|uniref:Biogenesis of lysosome-related organelles complex 1 subunit 6 n=1 Tax=Trichonephila clavata TaxID=2740835 RepID=A0A8X6G7U0_TRICU|nr:biogenesis of lysosome-related organelles complex 1 subunit 6 [Trichonephila clavata]
MCDVLSDTQQCTIIAQADSLSEKEILAQTANEDERNKDGNPEVLGKPDSSSSAVSVQLLEKLSNGILSFYVDDMKKTSSSLAELIRNQNIVIETLEQENERITDAVKTYPLDEMFTRIKLYHQKVLLLKKDMLTIHDRTSKLKKRAMKLQQQKQKEALQKELQRDREIERDKQLAPKIATKSTQGKLA